MDELEVALSRTAASEAVETIGWRYLAGTLTTSVAIDSFDQALWVAGESVGACGTDADGHLRVDLRADRVELSLQTRRRGLVTSSDVGLAQLISAAVTSLGVETAGASRPRPVQILEMAIDAIDIRAIRPFWKAVLAYTDDPAETGPTAAIVDPAGQLPAIWFQQMDSPRPQRNRVHFDITVADDEARARVTAALEAGGVLVDDSFARSFWVLADVEGNEVCVCTWMDRDERDALIESASPPAV